MPRGAWRDDPSIPNDAPLWRGIEPDDLSQDSSGNPVPSSGVLITFEVSVSIGTETTAARVIAKGLEQGHDWRWLWEFTAGAARAAGCIVDRDPQDDDPAHAVVLRADAPGTPPNGKRVRESSAKRLISNGRWQGEPPPLL
jgi:hypothetical protein